MDQVIIIPQPSQGLVITVETNGFVITAGMTAQLVVSINSATVPRTPVYLPLTVAEDGLSGSYTMTGTEFSDAGWYDVQLKVSASSTLLFSLQALKAVLVQGVLG